MSTSLVTESSSSVSSTDSLFAQFSRVEDSNKVDFFNLHFDEWKAQNPKLCRKAIKVILEKKEADSSKKDELLQKVLNASDSAKFNIKVLPSVIKYQLKQSFATIVEKNGLDQLADSDSILYKQILEMSSLTNSVEALDFILKKIDRTEVAQMLPSLLHLAAVNGAIPVLETLRMGFPIEFLLWLKSKSKEGCSPLHMALKANLESKAALHTLSWLERVEEEIFKVMACSKDHSGKTIFHYLILMKAKDEVSRLRQTYPEVWRAVVLNDGIRVEGVKFGFCEEEGRGSLLHLLVEKDLIEPFEWVFAVSEENFIRLLSLSVDQGCLLFSNASPQILNWINEKIPEVLQKLLHDEKKNNFFYFANSANMRWLFQTYPQIAKDRLSYNQNVCQRSMEFALRRTGWDSYNSQGEERDKLSEDDQIAIKLIWSVKYGVNDTQTIAEKMLDDECIKDAFKFVRRMPLGEFSFEFLSKIKMAELTSYLSRFHPLEGYSKYTDLFSCIVDLLQHSACTEEIIGEVEGFLKPVESSIFRIIARMDGAKVLRLLFEKFPKLFEELWQEYEQSACFIENIVASDNMKVIIWLDENYPKAFRELTNEAGQGLLQIAMRCRSINYCQWLRSKDGANFKRALTSDVGPSSFDLAFFDNLIELLKYASCASSMVRQTEFKEWLLSQTEWREELERFFAQKAPEGHSKLAELASDEKLARIIEKAFPEVYEQEEARIIGFLKAKNRNLLNTFYLQKLASRSDTAKKQLLFDVKLTQVVANSRNLHLKPFQNICRELLCHPLLNQTALKVLLSLPAVVSYLANLPANELEQVMHDIPKPELKKQAGIIILKKLAETKKILAELEVLLDNISSQVEIQQVQVNE